MSTARKVERVVAQLADAVARHKPAGQAYPAEMERLVTQQELALLSK